MQGVRDLIRPDILSRNKRPPVSTPVCWSQERVAFNHPVLTLPFTVATEFVTPAISTGGDGTPYGPYYAPMIPGNPHIKSRR
jgi:hypothetical protein